MTVVLCLGAENLWACTCTTILSKPAPSMGSASASGAVFVWNDLATLDFGGDLAFPIGFSFDSMRNDASPYVGRGGWAFPFLQSKAFLVSETQYRVELVNGSILYLQRRKSDHNQFASSGLEWIGRRQGDLLTVTGGGWELQFLKGRLIRVREFDSGRELNFVWSGSMVVGVREGSGSFELEVKVDAPSRLPKSIVINRQEFKVSFADERLQSIVFPDGRKERFSYGVDGAGNPTMTREGRDGAKTAYVWDAKKRCILSDGEFTYAIGECKSPYECPSLARTNKSGQTESFAFDSKGISSYRAFDGTITKRYFMMSPGINYMRLRKIERTSGGKTITVSRRSYDEQGRVIRVIQNVDGQDVVTTYVYDRNGKATAHCAGEEQVFQEKQQRIISLLKSLAQSPPKSFSTFQIRYDLAETYASQNEHAKAQELYLQIVNTPFSEVVFLEQEKAFAENLWKCFQQNSAGAAIQMETLSDSNAKLKDRLAALTKRSDNANFLAELKFEQEKRKLAEKQ